MVFKKLLLWSMAIVLLASCSTKQSVDYQVEKPINWPANIHIAKNKIENVSKVTLGKVAQKWKKMIVL